MKVWVEVCGLVGVLGVGLFEGSGNGGSVLFGGCVIGCVM